MWRGAALLTQHKPVPLLNLSLPICKWGNGGTYRVGSLRKMSELTHTELFRAAWELVEVFIFPVKNKWDHVHFSPQLAFPR